MVKKTPRRKIQVSLKFLQQTMKEVFVLMQEQSITPRLKEKVTIYRKSNAVKSPLGTLKDAQYGK
ncbi:hypothetical protein ACIPCB_09135 [Pediococcus pentosaceus]|uniref:hypothetical protein n=1 Tax=Pediococcus pentosaceus TaxID=1255 RepID=UPI001911939C|nr:hypothetical protein [Pediococcus pentosaceus]